MPVSVQPVDDGRQNFSVPPKPAMRASSTGCRPLWAGRLVKMPCRCLPSATHCGNGFAGLPPSITPQRKSNICRQRASGARQIVGGAVRGAYQDFLAGNRHPALALFIDIDPTELDVC